MLFTLLLVGKVITVRASDLKPYYKADLERILKGKVHDPDLLWATYQSKGVQSKEGRDALGDYLIIQSFNKFRNDTLARIYLNGAIRAKDYAAEEMACAIMAIAFQGQGKKDSIQKYFEANIAVKGGPYSNYAIGRCLQMKAYLENDLGNLTAAIKFIDEAIDYLKQVPSYFHLGNAYNIAGQIYGVTGHYKGTFAYYFKALEAYKKGNNVIGQSTIYNNIADIYIRGNMLDSSEFFITKAIKLLKENNGRPRDFLTVYFTYGELKIKQGKKKEGLQMMENALKDVGASDELRSSLTYYISNQQVLGLAYLENGYFQKAIEQFRAAAAIAEKEDFKIILLQLYGRIAEYHKATGRLDSALHYLVKSNGVRDFIRINEALKLNEELTKKLELKEKEQQLILSEEKNKFLELNLKETERTKFLGFSLMIVALVVIIGGYYVLLRIRKSNAQLVKANDEISKAEKALKRANNTKDRLFAIIAHDLRGPIGGLKSLPLLIRHATDTDGKLSIPPEDLASAVEKSVNPVYNLMEELLLWAQANQNELKLQIEQQPIQPLLERLKEVYQPLAEAKNVNLSISEPNTDFSGIFDSNTLFTILRNLVGNAIKFTPSGGSVQIKLQAEPLFKTLRIVIADTGKGISPQQIEKIYQAGSNQSTDGTEGEKGNGLGLVLVMELVKLNNITFSISSKEDIGTKVELSIPMA